MPDDTGAELSLQKFQNPWLNLPSGSPYILEIDRESVGRYNESVGAGKKINLESIPEPFIGNPASAKVVLLSLNPGDSDQDSETHKDIEFRRAMDCNLRHESQEYPFYALNPKFAWTGCGRWWRAHMKELLRAGLDLSVLADRLLVIEWFPYHSKKAALPNHIVCPSQEYSFQLAKDALDKNLIIVGMRSSARWVKVDPRFSKIPFLNSPQNPAVSIHNTGEDLFGQIVEAFR
jgi:hypothetical protein